MGAYPNLNEGMGWGGRYYLDTSKVSIYGIEISHMLTNWVAVRRSLNLLYTEKTYNNSIPLWVGVLMLVEGPEWQPLKNTKQPGK